MHKTLQQRPLVYQIQQGQKKENTLPVSQVKEQLPLQTSRLFPRRNSSYSSISQICLGMSLMVHLIFFLIAYFYLIDKQDKTVESHIAVDIVTQKIQKPRTRRRSLFKHKVFLPETTLALNAQHLTKTAVQLPVDIGESITLPAVPLSRDKRLRRSVHGWSTNRITILANQVKPTKSVTSPISTMPSRSGLVGLIETSHAETLKLRSFEAEDVVIPLSEATQPPRFIHKVVPKYPLLAKRAGKEGIVILVAEVGVDGKARNIEVVQGLGYGCDQSAINALRAARFRAAYKGKNPVVIRIQIPYRFEIEEK